MFILINMPTPAPLFPFGDIYYCTADNPSDISFVEFHLQMILSVKVILFHCEINLLDLAFLYTSDTTWKLKQPGL
jgi:hypothetical protein